jgi:4-diphosphocytidyl-2-C-methyl-D-erythritol kinase
MTVKRLSPAKINLVLIVGDRMGSGFHALFSLVAPIAIFDTVIFDNAPVPLSRCYVTLDTYLANHLGPEGSETFLGELSSERNLAFRAAEAFFAATGRTPSGRLSIHKVIPPQAGLGGGSSNAAAVLLLLNDIFGQPLTRENLLRLGAQLGSDVCLFLLEGWVVMEGRGEVVHRVKRPDWADRYSLLLKKPLLGMSTREAYHRLNRKFCALRNDSLEADGLMLVKELTNAEELNYELLRNDFEEAVALESWWQSGRDSLLSSGAKRALLCGSGSTICGFFSATDFSGETGPATSGDWWIAKTRLL